MTVVNRVSVLRVRSVSIDVRDDRAENRVGNASMNSAVTEKRTFRILIVVEDAVVTERYCF